MIERKLTQEERDMSEAVLKQKVLALAAAGRWKVDHLTHDGIKKPQRGAKGRPDLILVRAGVVWFMELKRVGQNLEPAQIEWMNAITDNGRLIGKNYLVVRPYDLGLVAAILR